MALTAAIQNINLLEEENAQQKTTIATIEEERDVLRDLLEAARPHVCSLLCESKWQTSEGQKHSDLCKAISCGLLGTADYSPKDVA